MTKLTYELYIRATPSTLWTALTDSRIVPRWRFGMSFETDWQPGSPLTSRSPNGVGTVRESDLPSRLLYDWTQSDHADANGGHPSTVAFELTPLGDLTRLSVVHDNLEPDSRFLEVVGAGWPMMLSGLKSLLETGQPLSFVSNG